MITKTKGAELWIALLQPKRWVCITIITVGMFESGERKNK
jgi:hypothetical protein